MSKLFILAAVALSGCASSPPVDVGNITGLELCQRFIESNYGTKGTPKMYFDEMARRNEDCSKYQGIIQAKIQADQVEHSRRAAFAASLQSIELSKLETPKPLVPAPVLQQTKTCNSRWFGGTLNTTCN